MIAANDIYKAPADVWARLAAPLPTGTIAWRQDGKPIIRDGKALARFVAYVEANTVRERLDAIVPGEWDLTLTPLVSLPGEAAGETTCSFKARLQVLGVVREDVGTGRDYKQAATDAFKRAAVRFGIAHELYSYGQNWVELDGEGRHAKPVEDPSVVYARRHSASTGAGAARSSPVFFHRLTMASLTSSQLPQRCLPHPPPKLLRAVSSPSILPRRHPTRPRQSARHSHTS